MASHEYGPLISCSFLYILSWSYGCMSLNHTAAFEPSTQTLVQLSSPRHSGSVPSSSAFSM